ncbi:probable fructokinase-7 [Durio zibethinus]|uniref:Probable fructokinase-7 n=1 Tax=Durio zibethinus TaxID=66656 RepID=A0A6P6ABK1_DURZI|nr:probable fructokinase-7 [Durio zibethinus]
MRQVAKQESKREAKMQEIEGEQTAKGKDIAKIFLYGFISLIEEPYKSAHHITMNIDKRSGSILFYDPNVRLPLWPLAEATWKWHNEYMGLSGPYQGDDDPYDDNVVIQKLFHPNLKLLVVTEGLAGCRYYTKHDI